MDSGHKTTTTCRPKRLQDALKPLLWSMKLFGVYHDVHDVTSISPSIPKAWPVSVKHNWSCCSAIHRFYSFGILIIMWANVVRYGVGLLPSDRYISLRIAVFVWFGLVALGDLIMFVICENKTYLASFYKHWDEIFRSDECITTECAPSGSPRAVFVGTAFAWSFVVMNMLTVMYVDFYADMAYVIARPFPINTVSTVLLLIVMCIATGIYAFPVAFIIVISYEVMSRFDKMTTVVEKHVKDAGDDFPLDIDKLRRFHLQLCKGVSILDRSIRLLVACEYVMNIPLACFLVYLLVSELGDLFLIISNLMWLTLNITVIMSVTLCCALVKEAVCNTSKNVLRHSFCLFVGLSSSSSPSS